MSEGKEDYPATLKTSSQTSPRRSILPSTYGIKEKKKKSCRSSFSPYARVLAVESHRDLSEEEKSQMWWQKCDYESFRRATSLLVRAMLNNENGNGNGWIPVVPKEDDSNSDNSKPPPITPNKNVASPKRQLPQSSLAEEQENIGHINQRAKTEQQSNVQAHAWWNRFGEISSFHESRRRQTHVKNSIRVVLDEQSRRRMFNTGDPMKIRLSYIQSTAWARDWAQALAKANADEVSQNFNDAAFKDSTICSLYAMKEALTAIVEKPIIPDAAAMNRLDANTSSQIQFQKVALWQQTKAPPSSPGTLSRNSSSTASLVYGDAKHNDLALAKKAAGFGANDSPNAVVPPLTS